MCKFIYFKILESLIGIQKLWKLIKLDLTKHNLQNIDPKITVEDLENWFIITKINNKFTFHKKFIEFLKNHPELYPREFQIIKENLISWITNSIISELDSRNVRFTISGKNFHHSILTIKVAEDRGILGVDLKECTSSIIRLC